jgi:hypothetical protein
MIIAYRDAIPLSMEWFKINIPLIFYWCLRCSEHQKIGTYLDQNIAS